MNTIFPNRRWLVIPTTITESIDFNQVLEYSPASLRFSVDGTKTFVKYEINEVTASYTQSYISAETNQTGSYTVEAGIYGRPSIYSTEYPEEDLISYDSHIELDQLTLGSPLVELSLHFGECFLRSLNEEQVNPRSIFCHSCGFKVQD